MHTGMYYLVVGGVVSCLDGGGISNASLQVSCENVEWRFILRKFGRAGRWGWVQQLHHYG